MYVVSYAAQTALYTVAQPTPSGRSAARGRGSAYPLISHGDLLIKDCPSPIGPNPPALPRLLPRRRHLRHLPTCTVGDVGDVCKLMLVGGFRFYRSAICVLYGCAEKAPLAQLPEARSVLGALTARSRHRAGCACLPQAPRVPQSTIVLFPPPLGARRIGVRERIRGTRRSGARPSCR